MKFKMIKTGVLFIGLISLSMTEMNAQDQEREKPTYSELLEHMDNDEDGTLSKNEVKGPLRDMFDKIDTDEDGYISEKEFDEAPKPQGRRPSRKQ